MTMTKYEALKLALSTLDEVRQETFRLIRDGQTLYAEDKVWSTIISIKEVLAQEQEPLAWISTGPARMIHWTADKPAYGDDWVPLYITPPQRKPLTDEDVERIVREARVLEHGIGYTIARAIEAAHNILEQGDKNE